MKAGMARWAVSPGLVASLLSASAFAAQPLAVDFSSSSLVDSAAARKIWAENVPAKVSKLYPSSKFRFASEVGGGFNDAKICVVNARAMLLPVKRLPIQGPVVVYAPVKSATAFDAAPNLSREQCQELARTKPFEEAKAELLTDYRKGQLIDKVPQIVEQARAELLKSPAQAEQIAQKYGLEIRRVEKWSGGGEFPLVGRSQELDFALGNLKKGGITEALELPNSRMVVGVLNDLSPARPGELNEVEDRVKAAVADTKSAKATEDAAAALDAKLKANGNDLRKAAAELNLKVIDSGDFYRSGQMPNLVGAFFGEQPFVNPIGFVASRFRIGAVLYFWKITGRTQADPASLAKERQGIVSMIVKLDVQDRIMSDDLPTEIQYRLLC